MEKKYKTKLDPKTGLLRIIALRRFSDVRKGEAGGLIEKEENLSHEGDCWVYGYAQVGGFARIGENAKIYGDVLVYQNARIYGDAIVSDNACVSGNTRIFGKTKISGTARVYGNAKIYDNACVSGNAWVYGEASIGGNAKIYGQASVYGNAKIGGDAWVSGNSEVYGDAQVYEDARIKGGARITAEICGNVKLLSTGEVYYITTSIKNNEDYIRLFINRKIQITPLSSNPKDIIIDDDISISGQNYIQNIKTIRQLYGETQISENAR